MKQNRGQNSIQMFRNLNEKGNHFDNFDNYVDQENWGVATPKCGHFSQIYAFLLRNLKKKKKKRLTALAVLSFVSHYY